MTDGVSLILGYSGAIGASFVPARPFTAGEHVSITVTVAGRSLRRDRFGVALSGRALNARDRPFAPTATVASTTKS